LAFYVIEQAINRRDLLRKTATDRKISDSRHLAQSSGPHVAALNPRS
jgi:hypothetical protein